MIGSPTTLEAWKIQKILNDFIPASGTSINKDKSQIFFFNTPQDIQYFIICILGFNRGSLPPNYFRVPLIDNSLRSSSWEGLLMYLEKRLNSWTFRTINLASHLVLIKYVLQAIPIYIILALVSPDFVLNVIKSLQKNFLW
jgi:hypothetical protein